MDINNELVQNQTLSHQLIQSMNILQMSTLELNEFINNTALENPVMELPDVEYSLDSPKKEDVQRKLSWMASIDYQNRIYYKQEKSDEFTTDDYSSSASEETLGDFLRSQLLLKDYTPLERDIIDFMIESLDSRGFLTEDISSIADYFVVSYDTVNRLLDDIKALDPAGVGARDLKECLLLQLYRRSHHSPVTETVIKKHLENVAKNHIKDIASDLGVSFNTVIDACEDIKSMNPKPGNSFSSRNALSYIIPDAVIVKTDGYFEILINESDYPSFVISSYYRELFESTSDPETRKYLQNKLSQASWIRTCITQRTSTLSKVLKCIVEKQQDFFIFGPGHKHPLRLSDISEEVKMHDSTVSRALKGKYLQCSHGVFPLNYFLSYAAVTTNDSDAVSQEQAVKLMKSIIDAEDKHRPLSDQAICEEMKKRNISISRRTVNKYRTMLGIPDKSGRKIYKE